MAIIWARITVRSHTYVIVYFPRIMNYMYNSDNKGFVVNCKVLQFSYFSTKTFCGYELEVPRWGVSNKYPQHILIKFFIKHGKYVINYTLDSLLLCISFIMSENGKENYVAWKSPNLAIWITVTYFWAISMVTAPPGKPTSCLIQL